MGLRKQKRKPGLRDGEASFTREIFEDYKVCILVIAHQATMLCDHNFQLSNRDLECIQRLCGEPSGTKIMRLHMTIGI